MTPLQTLDDPDVANCARTEGLKRLPISLALMRREGDCVALELDEYHPLLQSGFVGLDLARRHGQEAPAERLDRRNCQRAVALHRRFIRDRSISDDPVALLHGASSSTRADTGFRHGTISRPAALESRDGPWKLPSWRSRRRLGGASAGAAAGAHAGERRGPGHRA